MAKHVRIKMCGMTRKEDIAHAMLLGVDAIGLVFYPQSSRYIKPSQAKELLKRVPVFVSIVAVLVNPSAELVYEILNTLPIHYLQFHGDESSEFCTQFNVPYIKAIQVHSRYIVEASVLQHPQASAILLDTPADKMRGGSGMCFDWELIPRELSKPIILAGGLDRMNVQHVCKLHSIYAVDVCTGIELSPGIKDHTKMNQFIDALWGKNA